MITTTTITCSDVRSRATPAQNVVVVVAAEYRNEKEKKIVVVRAHDRYVHSNLLL